MFGFANLLACSFRNSVYTAGRIKSSAFSTFTQPLWMRVTPPMLGAPARKKKKGDPQLEKLRAEKKRKRLWRDVKRLMKMDKKLKPLEELDISYKILDNRELYTREKKPIPAEALDRRGELLREWTAYRTEQHAKDLQMIDRIEYTQHKALEELLKESPGLYRKAIEIDESFLPFSANGTTRTPPIKDYFNPDGEYVDTTRTWEAPVLPDKKQLKKMGIEVIDHEREAFFAATRKKKKDE